MARLGDICEIVSGTTPKSSVPEYWDGNINWVTPAELDEETTIIYESQRKITEQAVKDSSLKSFPAGTVLLSSRAPIGKVAIAGVEMYCNQGFKNLICSKEIHNKYLFWFLKSRTEYLNSLGRGATFKEISKAIVENIEIPLPPIDTQKQNAAALDKLNGLISLRKQQLAKLDELVKARFVEMFGDPLSNTFHWSTVSITKVCPSICGGGTPSKSHPEYFTGNIPWVSPKDMRSLILEDSIDHITEEAIKNSTTKLIPAKSVLMVIRSGILKHSLPVAINSVPVTINQDMKAFIPGADVTPEYLMYYFLAIKTDILAGIRGVTADNIDFKDFLRRSIIVPPILLQKKFTEYVEQMNHNRLTIQQSLDKLEVLKKSLMQEYFG